MVLVHVLPAIGGLVLSFKKLNIFTFHELFGAPWNGLENYRSILLDTDNPLHSGFWGAVVEHASVHVLDRQRARWSAGSPSRCCSTARCAASGSRAR